MQEMAQADYLLWVAPSVPRSADGVFAPDRDVEHTSRGAVALNPGFELAGARGQREIGKRALGRVRAQLDLTAGAAELDVGHGRKSPGREVSGQVESPLARDLDFPGAQVIGAPAGSRPAPILACQDGRVLALTADLDPCRFKPARRRHILEPSQVVRVHACDDRGLVRGEVVLLKGIDLEVVELQRRKLTATTGWVGRLADAAALDDKGLLETLVNRPQRCVVTQVPLAPSITSYRTRAVIGLPIGRFFALSRQGESPSALLFR